MDLFEKNIQKWTACEIVASLKSKQIKPIDIANAYVDYIQVKDQEVKAWECFLPEVFIKDVENQGNTQGKLFGVPFGVKDIFNTKDYPTEMGSKIWKDFTPGNNARVLDHLIWEGAAIIGKTVTAEFAVHAPGKTINPLNKDHIVGTSSSGSAAAVASGMVPIALGTQTAGSTLRPSSYCGIFGYKPSFGLLPRTGILKTLDTLDHVCLMAKNVKDIHLAFDCSRVRGSNHPYVESTVDLGLKQNSDSLKIGFVKTSTWKYAQDYTKKSLETFVQKISNEKNIDIEEILLPTELDSIHQNHKLIYEKALSYYFSDELTDHRDQISSIFLKMTDRGKRISTEDYRNGLKNQVKHIETFDNFMKDYDFLLCHTVAGEAPLVGAAEETDDPCLMWTYLHAPSISIPLFHGPSGMPFGLQLVSSRYNDAQLLNIASLIESKYLEE